MTISIGYLSDLHLEFRGRKFQNIIKMQTDVLCLNGDICACGNKQDFAIFIDFLKYICPKYKYVIHVAGNHEYYTAGERVITKWHTMQEIDKRFKALEKLVPNYIYLNCQAVTLSINNKQYVFIGATLWANVKPENYSYVEQAMNDYSYIYILKNNKIARFTVLDMQILHKKHVSFINKAITRFAALPCVVLTHHKPIADTAEPDLLTQAYETNLVHIIGKNKSSVAYAIHGHTHKQYDRFIGKVRYLSNPKGYIGQHTKFVDNISVKL